MDPHQKKIVAAAHQLQIAVEHPKDQWQMDAIRLRYQGKSEIVTLGRVFSHLNAVTDQIAANKVASKALLSEAGIPVPAGILLDDRCLRPEEIEEFLEQHHPVVVKPLFGTDGLGIAMHFRTLDEVLSHIRSFAGAGPKWLLEAQVAGEDLRIQYLNGKLIAACIRRPCSLRGDGHSSIRMLIDARNELIHAQNPDNIIRIDHQVTRRLYEVNRSIDTVLPEGVMFQIKDVSNMAQGGHAIDVTDRVHPRYLVYLNRLSDLLKMRLFSLDVMAISPESDPESHAYALEFNAQPAWLHHTFSEGRQHDIPTLILKDLFEIN